MRYLLLLLVPVVAAAQLRSAAITLEGIGCASCLESLPARIQRMRGVESATVDAARSLLLVRLAQENRVRVEQLRDAIQQDGTKAIRAEVTVRGRLEEQTGGTWMLRLAAPAAPWTLSMDGTPPSLQYSLREGDVVISGTLRGLAAPLTITPAKIDPASSALLRH